MTKPEPLQLFISRPDVAQETVRDFRDMPAECLPAAEWVDSANYSEGLDAWQWLRDFAAGRDMPLDGELVRLRADRFGWREGVVVRL